MTDADPKPVYVLFGPDAFLRDAHLAEIREVVLGDADPQLCLSRFESNTDLATVLDELRTLPFLAERRLVIVEDADEFVTANRQALEDYLDAPAATGTLVLLAGSWRSNTRLAKRVAQIGQAFDCSAPTAKTVGTFIRDRAKALGRTIDRDAIELLAQWSGTDLGRLAGEMEKLALYTQGRSTITTQDVSAIVVAAGGVNPFALTDALAAGDAQAALTTLDGLLVQRGDEFRTLGLITMHLRKVLKAKQMQAQGQREFDIFKAVRVFGPGQGPFRRLLASRDMPRVTQDFRQLIRTDLAIKTGRDPKAALQRLVVVLCG